MPKLFGTSIPKESRLTEQRNKASRNLDRIMSREIVALINREDRKVAVAVGKEIPAIAQSDDGCHYLEPQNPGNAAGKNRDRAGGWAGGADGVDADESGHGTKNGA